MRARYSTSCSNCRVTAVEFGRGRVVVEVRLRRRLLVCPVCGWSTAARHNWQRRPSTWRALDLGVWRVIVSCRLRRLDCQPCRRVSVEAVPFARHRARFTRDFEDLVAWLAQRCDKTAITQLLPDQLAHCRGDHRPGRGRPAGRPSPRRAVSHGRG